MMLEHNTCQSATKRLEDAVLRLTQHQATLTQAYSMMNDKLESILDHLSMMMVPPASPPLAPPPVTHHPHLNLEVPRFDG